METSELLDALVALADAVGLEVRVLTGATASGELPPQSAVCRVRGRLWVVLATTDPLERRVGVLADALVTHHASDLDDRYLAPAVRELLDSRGARNA